MKKLSKFEADLYKVCKKHQASFHQIGNAMKTVRTALNDEPFYQKPNQSRKIPRLPEPEELKRFFRAFDQLGNHQYRLWALLIYDAGIRVGEMVQILVNEINFSDNTILIRGKGHDGSGVRERLVTISPEIAELLKLHLQINKDSVWLFQNDKGNHYSARMVQIVFKKACQIAKIDKKMNPHKGRHVLITELTKAGIPTPVAQLQSGHQSEQGMAVYQHLAINQFAPQFNAVRQKFWAEVRG